MAKVAKDDDKGLLGIFSTYYKILFKPSEIVDKKMSVKDALLFYYKLAIIPFILFIIVGWLSISNIQSNTFINSLTGTILYVETTLIWHNYAYPSCVIAFPEIGLVIASGIFYILILYPLLAVILALIFLAVWKNSLQQVKGLFSATFTATIFSTIITLCFAWLIPSPLYSNYVALGFILIFILFIWGFAVLAIAISKQHNITRAEASGKIFAIFAPIALSALFYLSAFRGSVLPNNACITGSPYLCQNPVAYYNTGILNVIVGQNTGQNWVTANVIYVNASKYGYPSDFTPQNVTTISGGLASGESISVNIKIPPISSVSGPPGFVCPPSGYGPGGYIWAQYQTTVGGPFQYALIAVWEIA